MNLKISLMGMESMPGEVEANLEKGISLLHGVADSDLVVFPEMWTTSFDWKNLDRHLEKADEVEKTIARLAKERNQWIASTTLSSKRENQTTLFSPEGSLCTYQKIHLFPPLEEEKYLVPGGDAVITETPWGKIGFAICYDLRFPELFRLLAANGAQLIIVSAAFPLVRISHWDLLLRARAVENQLFIAGCNAYGHSALIDPSGETIAAGDGVVSGILDLDLVEEIRAPLYYLESARC